MTTVHIWNYFDIETAPLEQYSKDGKAGLDPAKAKIITIQYQPLYYTEGGDRFYVPSGSSLEASKLNILREWQSDESTLLRSIYEKFLSTPEKRYNFNPIGNNLSFEGKFLKYKFIQHGIIRKGEHLEFGRLWFLDLKHILIPINNGYGTYPKLLGKIGENKKIAEWYYSKQYDNIEKYIIDETESFVKTTDYLMKKLPEMRNEILAIHQ